MTENHEELILSDTFTPITRKRRFANFTDEIRLGDQKHFVSAYIERDGCLLVERIEDGKYVLPRDVISKGEIPQDALYRVLRTKYGVDTVIGDSIDLSQLSLQILHIRDKCYRVSIDADVSPRGLKWVKLVSKD